jgi:hypothetical protein
MVSLPPLSQETKGRIFYLGIVTYFQVGVIFKGLILLMN